MEIEKENEGRICNISQKRKAILQMQSLAQTRSSNRAKLAKTLKKLNMHLRVSGFQTLKKYTTKIAQQFSRRCIVYNRKKVASKRNSFMAHPKIHLIIFTVEKGLCSEKLHINDS